MVLNCGVGEDSWESLGLQGDPTSQSQRKSVLNIHWKDWCWSWNSNTLVTWCEELTHWIRPDAGKDWRQEEKGTTEDETVGWHHQLDEFEQAPGTGEGHGGLACCSPQGRKESDMTELNWLKKSGIDTRSLRSDLNQPPYDYIVEVTNTFKGLDATDRVPAELWTEVCNPVQGSSNQNHPKGKNTGRQSGCLRRPHN